MTKNQIEKQEFLFEDEWKMIFDIPNNFYKVGNYFGIIIEMHTDEQKHAGYPHCHAKYQDKHITISLKDFSVKDFDNMDSKHIKMAQEYVRNNIDFLIKKWNETPNVIKI